MLAKNKKFKRESRQGLFLSVIISIFILGVISLLVVSDYRMSKKKSELSGQVVKYQKEIRDLEERNAQLKQGINQARQESYWEEKAREQGYKKPGEEQAVVLSQIEESDGEPVSSQNFFQKILDKIGF